MRLGIFQVKGERMRLIRPSASPIKHSFALLHIARTFILQVISFHHQFISYFLEFFGYIKKQSVSKRHQQNNDKKTSVSFFAHGRQLLSVISFPSFSRPNQRNNYSDEPTKRFKTFIASNKPTDKNGTCYSDKARSIKHLFIIFHFFNSRSYLLGRFFIRHSLTILSRQIRSAVFTFNRFGFDVFRAVRAFFEVVSHRLISLIGMKNYNTRPKFFGIFLELSQPVYL